MNEKSSVIEWERRRIIEEAALAICKTNGHPSNVAAILENIPDECRTEAYQLYVTLIQQIVDKNKERKID